MRLSDLRDKRVQTRDGETIGRVHEVHCNGGRIVSLKCGPAGLIERWTGKSEGRRIAWESVVKIDRDGLVIAPDEPSASRSRRGTRPASGRRSTR